MKPVIFREASLENVSPNATIMFQPDTAGSFPCPVKKYVTQSSNPQTIEYENPLGLSEKAYATQQNLLSLEPYWRKHQLLDLCLTLPEDLPAKRCQQQWNSFLTNVVRPLSSIFVKIIGRTRKGRIHYHIACVVPGYCGRRETGKARLSKIRKLLRRGAQTHGFGITTVARVRDIEGYSIYLARHIDRSRLTEDRKLRRVSYSAHFKRVCTTRFSWMTPFAIRWRKAVQRIAERYGYKSSDRSRRWVWEHYREIGEEAERLELCVPDFTMRPRTVLWENEIWTVLRFPENRNIFALQRPAAGDERFNSFGPIDRTRPIYTTVTKLVWRRHLQRLVNAQRLHLC
jgi:hypothetical protein